MISHRIIYFGKMLRIAIFLLMFISINVLCYPKPEDPSNELSYTKFGLVTRGAWGANPPSITKTLRTPVEFVVIHHSLLPAACFNINDCSKAMRSMQNYHQNTNGWGDIGYNFAVGSDGRVYEGRGWRTVGAHSLNFNSVSIGIVLIGDWRSEVPPRIQLETTRQLITAGVNRGIIRRDHKLVGHRQLRATECPGDALFMEISIWNNFTPKV